MYTTTLGSIRAMDVSSTSVDELVLAYSTVATALEGYAKLGVDVPEYLTGLQKDIKREVENRTRTEKERKLKTLRARREALKTPDEKRAGVDAQIAALEKELA